MRREDVFFEKWEIPSFNGQFSQVNDLSNENSIDNEPPQEYLPYDIEEFYKQAANQNVLTSYNDQLV